MSGHSHTTIFPSLARTVAPGAHTIITTGFRGIKLVINCTADPVLASVTFVIQGIDRTSGVAYTMLTSAAVAAVGTTVLTIYPNVAASANVSLNDVIPDQLRITATHGNSDSITYSVGATLIT